MGYIYSDPSRETEEHALPNVEVFYARPVVIGCNSCGNSIMPWNGEYDTNSSDHECPICLDPATHVRFAQYSTGHYWYWACFAGCLPDSEPIGPFVTEAEAIADAQE